MPSRTARMGEDCEGRAPPAGRPMGVLILDDDRFDRTMMERALAKTGLNVESDAVATLESFGAALDRRSYDLILVDFRLGDADGFSAQDIVISHDTNASTPVVLVSSQIGETLARASVQRGIFECLEKSKINGESLLELLNAVSQALVDSTRQWFAQLLRQHRRVVAEDMRRIMSEELDLDAVAAHVETRVMQALAARGAIAEEDPVFLSALLREPDNFQYVTR